MNEWLIVVYRRFDPGILIKYRLGDEVYINNRYISPCNNYIIIEISTPASGRSGVIVVKRVIESDCSLDTAILIMCRLGNEIQHLVVRNYGK